MILDSFRLANVTLQIQYDDAFELWDRSGAVARRMRDIWPSLKMSSAQPHLQILVGTDINLQTGFNQANITISGNQPFEPRKIQQLDNAMTVWREELSLKEFRRVSTRAIYIQEFPSAKEANDELRAMNLVRWPSVKVFDQSEDGERNTADIQYRFEDDTSFAFLRIKTEQIKIEFNIDPQVAKDSNSESKVETRNDRVIIDFDRGILGSVVADKFRVEDWFKGFQHLLRRDLEKITKGTS